MRLALGLTTLATALAAVVAYGTHPTWAQFPHGLDVILWSRRLQWPVLFASLAAAVGLAALVGSGRQRAWWLLGLAPVLALFAHRFATDPTSGMAAVENPAFVAAAQAKFLNDDDFVVGLTFGDKSYAYPYAALYSTPAVIHAQHDKRVLVMWSAPANRALAVTVRRDVRARELDVVSTPANALLLFDTGHGQFINGLTGQTPRGDKPQGFGSPVPTWKMPWRQWRKLHGESLVMVPSGPLAAQAPRQPLLPTCPLPRPANGAPPPVDVEVVVIGSSSPAAVAAKGLKNDPVNLTADGVPVMAFRDPETRAVRAFARRVEDLSPRFALNTDAARRARGVMFVDSDTHTGWNADGVPVDARKDLHAKRLAPVPVEDGLYWSVMKYWYPQMQLMGGTPVISIGTAADEQATTKPSLKEKRSGRADRARGTKRRSPAR